MRLIEAMRDFIIKLDIGTLFLLAFEKRSSFYELLRASMTCVLTRGAERMLGTTENERLKDKTVMIL